MFVRMLQSVWRNREGTALIESAIVLPVLLTLVLGVFEFSWIIFQQHLISTGVRDAARYIARSADPHDPATRRSAKDLATTGAVDGKIIRIRGWSADAVDIAYQSLPNPVAPNGSTRFRGGPIIQVVTVSTVFTVHSLGFFNLLGLKPPAFSVSHQERIIGPG